MPDLASAPEHLADAWLRAALRPPCHDEPMPGAWFCGSCPYTNVGTICTKCAAHRYEGTAFA